MEFSNDEEEKSTICLMTKPQDDEVTSQFSYHNLFILCKKLTKEANKLEQIISTYKDTISSMKLEKKT